MAEVFFVLITVYAVYVIHSVLTRKRSKKTEDIVATPEPVQVKQAVVKEEKAEVVKAAPKPAAKKAPVAKAPATKKPAVKAKSKPKAASKAKAKPKADVLPSGSVRHPETGEVAKIAANYRMTKRWIKEALVEEGLLSKIYKTNEIDDAEKVKIDAALTKFQKLDKYQ